MVMYSCSSFCANLKYYVNITNQYIKLLNENREDGYTPLCFYCILYYLAVIFKLNFIIILAPAELINRKRKKSSGAFFIVHFLSHCLNYIIYNIISALCTIPSQLCWLQLIISIHVGTVYQLEENICTTRWEIRLPWHGNMKACLLKHLVY